MEFLTTLALLFLAAAVISIALSVLGVVAGFAIKLLPIVFIVLAALFFVKGGRVHIEWPRDDDDGVIDVEAHRHED